jgi:hypothetical protein
MQINTPAALIMRIANRIAKAEEENTGSAVDALGAEVLTLLRLSRNDLNRIYDRAKAISEQLIETQHENFELAV